MAKFNSKERAFRKSETCPARRVIELATMMDCFEFDSLVRAAHRGRCGEIQLRAVYADYREPGYNADATMDCVQLHTFFTAVHILNQYGYRLREEVTDGYLSFGRKAVTLTFQEVREHDVYPESSRSN